MSGAIIADMFLPLSTLSASAYLHFKSSITMADMFLPLLLQSLCVFLFHAQHNHGWNVPITFDSQPVCISISWAAQSWLTCSPTFRLSASAYFHFMSTTITTDIFLPLSTRSASAYFHFMSGPIVADMFAPLLTLRQCVLPLMSSAGIAGIFLPLSTLSQCVFSFNEHHNHYWHVPATFDSQPVGISIP